MHSITKAAALLVAFDALAKSSHPVALPHDLARDIIQRETGSRPTGIPPVRPTLKEYLEWMWVEGNYEPHKAL